MKKGIFPALIAAGIFLLSCGGNGTALKQNEIAGWKQNLLKERAKTDNEFKHDPLSPMAGIARLNISAGKETFLVPDETGIRRAGQKDGAALQVYGSKGNWTWRALSDTVSCKLNGKPCTGNRISDEMVFSLGRYTLQGYPEGDTLVLLVFDSKRPELLHFQHLRYFKPNPGLVVNAKVERIRKPDKITMLTSRNLVKSYYRYAILHFRVNGKDCRLTAYKMNLKGAYDDLLFIPFRDATSGKESYGAGRFLELKETPGDTMRLDFNLAFNPLCNYSPAYNCPVPPAENTLPVPIRAGEMAYPHEKKENH
ncbi:MAG: DUF1684 domain-containing protein [Acidobacteria bacterium]|nr:DUF1684 domain-containing protein [Acidobacteriota bacterium]